MSSFTAGVPNVTVNVYQGNNPSSLGALLYSAGSVAVSNASVTTIPLGSTSANQLTLRITEPAGPSMSNSYVVDNIVFGQVAVPEPASIAMLGTAVCGVMFRRSRRLV
jgi:hypothetical protein